MGIKHPNYIKLDFWEIEEWQAYFKLHPFGHDVDHMMQARIAASMSGLPEGKLMPMVKRDLDYETMKSQFSGLSEYMESLSGNH